MDKIEIVSLPVEQLKSLIIECISISFKDLKLFNAPPIASTDQLFTVKSLAVYLNVSVPTIRSLVKSNSIACVRTKKLLYFKHEDVQAYLQAYRYKSQSEIEIMSNEYLKKKRGCKGHK